jgi:hypothetical protein
MSREYITAFTMSLLLLSGFSSCSPVKVSYLGNDFATTNEVELFFSRKDLPRNYRVMGEMIITAPEGVKSKKVQQALQREARQKGANGALITTFEMYQEGIGLNSKHHYGHHSHEDTANKAFTGTLVKVELLRYSSAPVFGEKHQ